MRKIPAIVTDIDGVLIRGDQLIKGSETVLKRILNNQFKQFDHNSRPFTFPFVCLTNGGGYVEDLKAASLNKIFDDSAIVLSREHIILNFTPLRQIFQQEYIETPVLCCGSGQIIDIAYNCGLKYFIHIEEYASLYQAQSQTISKERPIRQTTIQILKERYPNPNCKLRFQVSEQEVESIVKNIKGIFILHDPVDWEDSLQAIMDLCQDKDLPIFVVNDDTIYADTFRIPRLAFGSFTSVLKVMMKNLHNKELDIKYYGKPTLNTSNYTRGKYLNDKYQDIGNVYMIGDNPKSDIRGAILAGWKSILVRTGVFQGNDNDLDNPADFVVADMKQAFDLILQKESLIQI